MPSGMGGLVRYFDEYKSTIMQKIHNAFNCPNKKVEWDNEYKPNIKIQSTVKSDTKMKKRIYILVKKSLYLS